MQNSFGIDGMLFEVESVMSTVMNEEPTPFLELTGILGAMDGLKFIVGEFKMKDELYDNGDGQLQFSVSFLDKNKKENNELSDLYTETINKIVLNMVENIVKDGLAKTEV